MSLGTTYKNQPEPEDGEGPGYPRNPVCKVRAGWQNDLARSTRSSTKNSREVQKRFGKGPQRLRCTQETAAQMFMIDVWMTTSPLIIMNPPKTN